MPIGPTGLPYDLPPEKCYGSVRPGVQAWQSWIVHRLNTNPEIRAFAMGVEAFNLGTYNCRDNRRHPGELSGHANGSCGDIGFRDPITKKKVLMAGLGNALMLGTVGLAAALGVQECYFGGYAWSAKKADKGIRLDENDNLHDDHCHIGFCNARSGPGPDTLTTAYLDQMAAFFDGLKKAKNAT